MPFVYQENFITQDLDVKVQSLPKGRWVSLKNRRLQEWGARSVPNETRAIGEELPDWLQSLSVQIQCQFPGLIPEFNQCLINEYQVGQGIMPHEDGPCYDPVIATVSLGGHTILDLYPKSSSFGKDSQICLESEFSLLLEPRSILILSGEYYTDYLHGIKESLVDEIPCSKIVNFNSPNSIFSQCRTQTRISLTFRRHKNVIRPKYLRFK